MVYTLTGKNTFALSKHLESIIAEFVETHGELALERLDASEKDVDTILQAAQNLPFLAEKKLVVVKQAAANSQLLERVTELVDRNPESIDVYLVDQAFDKRKSSYKDLKKLTNLTEFKDQDSRELTSWVQNIVEEQGGLITRQDAQLLVDRVGAKEQLLSKEIEKLLIYSPDISKQSILLLTDESVQSSVFSLLDAAFQGDQEKTLQLYQQQRSAQVDPNYIIAMLTWQLQSLALAVHADPKSESTLVAAGQSSYAARKALQLAKRVSKKQLQTYVADLSDLDAQIKNSAAHPDAALELFLIELTTS